MIKYSLSCDKAHGFEGWFSESADFDRQLQGGLLVCPVCGSGAISKSLMAPSVSTAKRHAVAMDAARAEAMAKLRAAVAEIKANAEDVGERFPEEARKMHYGETDARGIIGQASFGEVRELLDEGIEIAPIPVLPDDAN